MNKRIILTDVKEKLRNARTLCPGMSDDVYLITDFMGEICNDDLYPEGLVLKFAEVIFDISRSYNSSNPEEDLLEELVRRKEFILNQVPYFLQVVDVIAEAQYAKIFRSICSDVLKIEAPRRIMVDNVNGYSENVVIATEWWANAIQAPRYGDSINPLISRPFAGKNKEKTEEEIMSFKYDLANGIVKELESNGKATIYVDINAGGILKYAGKRIGLEDLIDYPVKTKMTVTEDSVIVEENGNTKVLWSSNKLEQKPMKVLK